MLRSYQLSARSIQGNISSDAQAVWTERSEVRVPLRSEQTFPVCMDKHLCNKSFIVYKPKSISMR